MEIDREGDKEPVSERKSTSQPPRDQSLKPEPSDVNAPIEIPGDGEDEEEEDGDEEAYAVEKVLAHKIGKKSNVRVLRLPRRILIAT